MTVWHRWKAAAWHRLALECAGWTGRCLLAEDRALCAAARGRNLPTEDPAVTRSKRMHPSSGGEL